MAHEYYYSPKPGEYERLPQPNFTPNAELGSRPTVTHVHFEAPVPQPSETKPRYGLLPYDALEEVAKVFTFGAAKHGERDWEKGLPWSSSLDALGRHISAFNRGESNDPETGYSHLSHAIARALILLAYQLRGVGKDDRSITSSRS